MLNDKFTLENLKYNEVLQLVHETTKVLNTETDDAARNSNLSSEGTYVKYVYSFVVLR